MNKEIELKEGQRRVLNDLKNFLKSSDRVFMLKGYAGTGKTTLMKFLIEHLQEERKLYNLLAPTGRAAKILTNYTEGKAQTIHGMIYRYKSFNKDTSDIGMLDNGQLYLVFAPSQRRNDNNEKGVIYIIDESSMVGDLPVKNPIQAKFGSGRLLKELFDFDQHKDSKFIFVGDPAQLPPIQGTISPALEKNYIEGTFNYRVQEGKLTEIVRQENTIVQAANSIRKQWQEAPMNKSFYGKYTVVWGAFEIRKYPDIVIMNNFEEMIDNYKKNIKEFGYNHSIFICRSNKRCAEISHYIRENILGFQGIIKKGDLLMVTQNQFPTGLMNGDMVEVMEIGERKILTPRVGNARPTPLNFREVKVKELFTKRECTTILFEDCITCGQGNLNEQQQKSLFIDFIARMLQKGITEKKKPKEFENALRNDSYLNALRCSYGYAVTCHKAQGGEWNNVYIDLIGARNITRNPIKEAYQWMYTAVTRAKDKVFLKDDFFIK
jgi:ATP-dependent exoDNAse (exonuclease V) alpha subunit